MSSDFFTTRALAAKGISRQTADDTPIGIRLFNRAGGAVTSVTVTTATNIVMITANGGTDTYAFATYTTMGALADAINADGIFECRVVDALRSDSTGSSAFLENTAITAGADANGTVCWDVHIDTSAVDKATVNLAPWVLLSDAMPSKGHRLHLQEINYNENVSGAEAGAVRVYQRKGTVETLVFAHVSVDATVTSVVFASGQGKITGDDGAELIARVVDGTSITDATSNYIRAVGIYE